MEPLTILQQSFIDKYLDIGSLASLICVNRISVSLFRYSYDKQIMSIGPVMFTIIKPLWQNYTPTGPIFRGIRRQIVNLQQNRVVDGANTM
jgi:hypothetical protein